MFRVWAIKTHLSVRNARDNNQMMKTAPAGGRQDGSKRISRIRLWANTAECTYA